MCKGNITLSLTCFIGSNEGKFQFTSIMYFIHFQNKTTNAKIFITVMLLRRQEITSIVKKLGTKPLNQEMTGDCYMQATKESR